MSTNREPVTVRRSTPSSAVGVCEDLIAWYGKYAARARDRYRVLEVALLIVGASISVAALAWRGNGVPAALPGGIVVVLTRTGVRAARRGGGPRWLRMSTC